MVGENLPFPVPARVMAANQASNSTHTEEISSVRMGGAGTLPPLCCDVIDRIDGPGSLLQPVTDVLSLHDTFNSTRVQNHAPVFVLRANTGRWKPGPGYADRVLDVSPAMTLCCL